eukprot:2857990-Pyramimonas_sp.AAC.1
MKVGADSDRRGKHASAKPETPWQVQPSSWIDSGTNSHGAGVRPRAQKHPSDSRPACAVAANSPESAWIS